MHALNWIDLLLAFFFVLCIWRGWDTGFLEGILGTLAWLISFVAGAWLYRPAAELLARFVDAGDGIVLVILVLIVLLVRWMLGWFKIQILRYIPIRWHENLSNKMLGLIPAAITACILGMLFSYILFHAGLPNNVDREARESKYAIQLGTYANWCFQQVK